MSEGKTPNNILSIESAVAGGSVALITERSNGVLKHDGEVASRAEKIIPTIVDVLEEGSMTLGDLDMIAVSIGPGSYSGIRIGVATAIGLANALDIPCIGVSVLEAMAFAALPIQKVLAAILVGKNDIAWQPFLLPQPGKPDSAAEPQLLSLSSFIDELADFADSTLLAPSDLLIRLADLLPEYTRYVDMGTSLAECVGKFASSKDKPGNRLQPIYLRNRDANIGRAGF